MTDRPGFRSAVKALRYRNFRLFWTGGLVSTTGTWMQILAVPFVIHELTGSGTWVGVVGFSQMVPTVIMGPFAGALADRVPRRTILIFCQAALATVAFAFAAAWMGGVRSPAAYLVLGVVYGFLNGVMTPSWQAFVSELVPREALLNAVTLNSTQFQASRAVGPALGGVILAVAGPGWAFLANAISFVGVLWGLSLIRVPRLVSDDPPPIRIVEDFKATRAYIGAHPGIRRSFRTVVITASLGQPLVHLIVVIAEEVFEVGGGLLGLMAAAIGIGAIVFFPLIAGWGSFVRRSRLMSIALVVYGCSLIGFGLSPWYPLAVAMLMIIGAAHLTNASTLNTVIQMQVDEDMRGKVLALYLMTITSSIPLGTLGMGILFDVIGPRATVAGAGAIMFCSALWLIVSGRLSAMDLAHE